MQQFFYAIEQRLIFFSRHAGRKIFVGLVAGLLFALGLFFVTYGLWLVIRGALGPLVGALVLGILLLAAGMGALYLGTIRRRVPPPPPPPPAYSSPRSASIVAMVEAFMVGLQAAKGDRPPQTTGPERSSLGGGPLQHTEQISRVVQVCDQVDFVRKTSLLQAVVNVVQGREVFDRKADAVE